MGGALISPCERYRYVLTRDTKIERYIRDYVVFVMLNPSTADATEDDPTIRRCIGFAQRLGYRRLKVVNLYAYRATDPKDLLALCVDDPLIDPVGEDNDIHLFAALSDHWQHVICAWGTKAKPARVKRFAHIAELAGARLCCLDITKGGMPKHPLYIKGDTQLKPWSLPSG